MPALGLDIDLDPLADLVEASSPWLEGWIMLLALVLGVAVLLAARDLVRSLRSPVRRLLRR